MRVSATLLVKPSSFGGSSPSSLGSIDYAETRVEHSDGDVTVWHQCERVDSAVDPCAGGYGAGAMIGASWT